MEIIDRLTKLRELMKEHNLTMYYVPTDDYHMSEYVGDFFKERVFMSGFTGSAGVLLVTLDKAYLWTDGRYFLQAEKQLAGSTIELMKMGNENVPTVLEFVNDYKGVKRIGFDGRCVSVSFGRKISEIDNIYVDANLDLVNDIWQTRPKMSAEKGYFLDIKYAGVSRSEKLEKLQKDLVSKNATVSIISSLDDIMWTLNLRGNDVVCNPVILSYLAIYKEKAILYINESTLTKEMISSLSKDHVIIRKYNDIYTDVSNMQGETVILDADKTNYKMLISVNDTNKVIFKSNYSTMLKACKNNVEVSNIKKAHLKDAVAMCKFMYWLKTNVGKVEMSEISVSEKLLSFRKEGSNFKDVSFGTIAGFGSNGAIVHYSATKETDTKVVPNSFLLVDSGGHYLEGTTDITRTFALGKVNDEMRHHFTLVLKSYLALSDARFIRGVKGYTLDMLARKPLWNEGLDFNHGTGHGVGYLLNVHEGPQGIKYNRNQAEFHEGMVTSDEPGLYLTGKYGIRHESLLLCKRAFTTEFGDFLEFEPLTLVPFDLDGINADELTKEEINKLNSYHQRVYEKVSPLLSKEEAKFLRKYTKAI